MIIKNLKSLFFMQHNTVTASWPSLLQAKMAADNSSTGCKELIQRKSGPGWTRGLHQKHQS